MVVHFPEDVGFYVTVFLGLLEVLASPKLDFPEGLVVRFPEDVGFYVMVFLGLLEVLASPKLDFPEGTYLHYVQCNFSMSGIG
jgi:hypothetical protein